MQAAKERNGTNGPFVKRDPKSIGSGMATIARAGKIPDINELP
jgi:hypothetical protein